jgi:hypothetical protein
MSAEHFQKLADSKFDIKAKKLSLLEQVDSRSTFTWGGGLFKATPTLIAYVMGLVGDGKDTGYVVILDEYNNPIRIVPARFLEDACEANQYALNAYDNDFERLKKVRKGDKL